VNLIGEHIDYNDGFVMPMAIPLYTIIVGCQNDTGSSSRRLCRVKSMDASLAGKNYAEFSLDELKKRDRELNWINYIIGVVANFSAAHQPAAFDAVIISNVPLGSGLSSSAALEVAVFTFLENLTNRIIFKIALAMVYLAI
jgi:galactokinase